MMFGRILIFIFNMHYIPDTIHSIPYHIYNIPYAIYALDVAVWATTILEFKAAARRMSVTRSAVAHALERQNARCPG